MIAVTNRPSDDWSVFTHAEKYRDHDISIAVRRQVGGGFAGQARIWWDMKGVRAERLIPWPESAVLAGDEVAARHRLVDLALRWIDERTDAIG